MQPLLNSHRLIAEFLGSAAYLLLQQSCRCLCRLWNFVGNKKSILACEASRRHGGWRSRAAGSNWCIHGHFRRMADASSRITLRVTVRHCASYFFWRIKKLQTPVWPISRPRCYHIRSFFPAPYCTLRPCCPIILV